MQVITMQSERIVKGLKVLNRRETFVSKDTLENRKKRNNWRDYLLVHSDVRTCEMYPDGKGDVLKSKLIIPQFEHESKYHNTRTQMLTETRAEIDKLPYEKALKVLGEIIEQLKRLKVHFAVFYAEGGRSPHIIIYDLDIGELSPYKRLRERARFWRAVSPFFFHYLDHGLFDDEHLVPLEFSPHWKHGSVFDLVFEWIPEEEKCKD